MSTRTILALAVAAGVVAASGAMAQPAATPSASAPGTGASSGSSPPNSMPAGAGTQANPNGRTTAATPSAAAPATGATAGATTHASTGMHHMAMRHTSHHVMRASAKGHMTSARSTGGASRDGGDAAVDQLNAQSLARARGQGQ